MIDNSSLRASVLGKLGAELAGVQLWERTEAIWTEVEALIGTITNFKKRDLALRKLATTLAKMQQWQRADGLIREITDRFERRWVQAETVSLGIQVSDTRTETLNDLAKILYSFGKHVHALRLVHQASL